MRIAIGKHPAAAHITDVLLGGVPLMRGTCAWVDLVKGEACIYLTDGDGKPYVKDGAWAEKIIRGALSVRIPDEHRHLLSWEPGS
jgi:hypothetical protein